MFPEQGQEEPSKYDEITDKVTYRGHCIISVNQVRYTYSVLYCRVVCVVFLCVDPLRLIFDSMRNRASFDRVCVCVSQCVRNSECPNSPLSSHPVSHKITLFLL